MNGETVISQFDAVAVAKPGKIAIFWGREKISYRDLAARINACSAALQAYFGAVATALSRRAQEAPRQSGAATSPSTGGIVPGDRVGLLLKNSPEFIYALYAALKLGATVVPINTFLKPPEIQHIADDCQLKCLITSPDFDDVTGKLQRILIVPIETLSSACGSALPGAMQTGRGREAAPTGLPGATGQTHCPDKDVAPTAQDNRARKGAPTLPTKPSTLNSEPGTPSPLPTAQSPSPEAKSATVNREPGTVSPSPAPFHPSSSPASGGQVPHPSPSAPPLSSFIPHPSSLALIIYTSGTTGKSKGAMLTHANIASNVLSCVKALEETTDDRLTLLLPMFHSFMLTVCIFTPLSMGAGIVLIKSIHPLKAAMREMIMNRATIFVGIPQIFQALAEAKIPFWLHWVLKLRLAVSGAAPLPGEVLQKFDRKFRFPLLEGYGLSEAAPVVSFNPMRGVRKAGSVGLPLPDIEVQVFDDHDHELPAGEVGEIVVRGPNVMRGYYNHAAETAMTLRSGWLHTGDMGKQDDEGYIYIVDRRKEMLLVRGMNVYPREIEEVLHRFPNVREVAVVPKADEKRGEIPIAFVSPVDGAKLDANEMLKFLRDHLADYKIPKEIRILEALPRTATGKIAKLELKKKL